MIVSKTPLRLSFFSGGSDLPAFYKKEMGAALSVTINKHIYICAHRTPNNGIKTMYDSIEQVADLKEMQDGLTKEVLRFYDIKENITIASISDILSRGSGLGSSSAFTVGLINSLSKYKTNNNYFIRNFKSEILGFRKVFLIRQTLIQLKTTILTCLELMHQWAINFKLPQLMDLALLRLPNYI